MGSKIGLVMLWRNHVHECADKQQHKIDDQQKNHLVVGDQKQRIQHKPGNLWYATSQPKAAEEQAIIRMVDSVRMVSRNTNTNFFRLSPGK